MEQVGANPERGSTATSRSRCKTGSERIALKLLVTINAMLALTLALTVL